MIEQIKQIASDVFGVSAASLSESSSPESVEAWDSVQHLSLVMALEERFNVQFAPEDVEKLRTLADVAAMVRTKAGTGR